MRQQSLVKVRQGEHYQYLSDYIMHSLTDGHSRSVNQLQNFNDLNCVGQLINIKVNMHALYKTSKYGCQRPIDTPVNTTRYKVTDLFRLD